MSQSDYDKIKEEYKAHYQKLKELKDRVAQAKHTQRITKALQDMDPKPVLDSVDEMIDVIKHKAAEFEAKLSVAFDDEILEEEQKTAEFELELQKQKARETINQLKNDLYDKQKMDNQETIEDQKPVEKTLGKSDTSSTDKDSIPEKSNAEIKKTIGPKK